MGSLVCANEDYFCDCKEFHVWKLALQAWIPMILATGSSHQSPVMLLALSLLQALTEPRTLKLTVFVSMSQCRAVYFQHAQFNSWVLKQEHQNECKSRSCRRDEMCCRSVVVGSGTVQSCSCMCTPGREPSAAPIAWLGPTFGDGGSPGLHAPWRLRESKAHRV